MIFVTVGSSSKPFDRLVCALTRLPLEELVVQHGPNRPPDGVLEAKPFMAFPDILKYMDAAAIVVSHAGVGSIMCALHLGHTPVIVPRLGRLGETVDDHQSDLARALEEAGKVVVVWDVGDLADALSEVPPRQPRVQELVRPLHDAVRSALSGPAS